jgi:hypothetical protein
MLEAVNGAPPHTRRCDRPVRGWRTARSASLAVLVMGLLWAPAGIAATPADTAATQFCEGYAEG